MEETEGEGTEKQRENKGNCALMGFKVGKGLACMEESREAGGGGWSVRRWGARRASKLPGESLLSSRILGVPDCACVSLGSIYNMDYKQCEDSAVQGWSPVLSLKAALSLKQGRGKALAVIEVQLGL